MRQQTIKGQNSPKKEEKHEKRLDARAKSRAVGNGKTLA
jgi:hypothetical protein